MRAVHGYLARTPCKVLMVQLEDVLGVHRPGQRAWDHGPVSQLAPQAAPRAGALARRTSASRPCALRSRRSAHPGRRNAQNRPPVRCQRQASHGRPTVCSCMPASASAPPPALVPYLAALGVSHVYCSPYLRARSGQHARLRHHRSQRAQSRDRQPGGIRAVRAGAAGAWHGTDPGPGAQPHGRHGSRQPLVDGCARERPGVGLRRLLRHRLGAGQPGAAPQDPGAGAGRSLRCGARARRHQARLRAGGRRLRAVLFPAPLSGRAARVSAHPRARAASAAGAGGRRHRARRVREPDQRVHAPAAARRDRARAHHRAQPRQGGAQAPPGGVVPRASRRGRGHRGRRASHQRHAGETRAASTRCTSCWRPRPTGWPTGAWPPTRSTTGASSTSTTWRRCAWRTRRCSRRPTAWCWSWWRAARCRGCASTIPTGSTIRRSISSACRSASRAHIGRRARQASPAARCRSTWWSKRSPPGTSAFPRAGRCTAPPATGSPTSSTACSWTPPTRSRFDRIYRSFTGEAASFEDVVYASKRLILRNALSSELNVLASQLARIAQADRRTRDFTLNTPAPGARRGDRLLPRLSHLHRRARLRAGPALHRMGGRPRQAAQPGERHQHLRFRPLRPARSSGAGLRPGACAAGAQLRHEVPAVHRAGHRQGRGGHRLLPLQPPGVAERGRRRSATASASPWPRFTAPAWIARSAGRTPCWPAPPTTASARRTCARASTCCPRCRPRGG